MSQKESWWGRSTSLDLHGCDPRLLRDPEAIKHFIRILTKSIKMKRHGPTRIDRFGEGKLKGWSAMQFIQTSSIVVHCDDKSGRAFIDIFSCKRYNPRLAADLCKKYFKAKTISTYVEERQ